MATRRHNPNRARGIIDPRCWYSKAEILAMGFGRPFLAEGRKAGVISGRISGKRIWFHGKELVRWLEQQGPATPKNHGRQAAV